MNKLKKKIFYLTFSILSLSVFSFIVVLNVQKYIEQKHLIENDLKISSENKSKPNNHEPIKFMDKVIYTVILDNTNNIKDIINMANDNLKEDDIKKIASEILNSKSLKNKYIGCLYFEDYSYTYFKGNYLIILDNHATKSSLLNTFYNCTLLFIILEIVVYIVSKIITNWIIKPVVLSFSKQKQFIADASHELKTPLSVIVASSEALSNYPNEKKWLTNIKNEADRINTLISDLLDLTTSEKKDIYNFKKENLSKVVELAVLTFEGKAFENNIKLEENIKENIIIKFDENSIKQLIEILLDNAIKHAKKGSVIKVFLTTSFNQIILTIENEGDEIPKGEEKKIFERFYRVNKSRNRKENRYGLGLAIAKNIVTNHNGIIKAKSNNGITTFKILLKI